MVLSIYLNIVAVCSPFLTTGNILFNICLCGSPTITYLLSFQPASLAKLRKMYLAEPIHFSSFSKGNQACFIVSVVHKLLLLFDNNGTKVIEIQLG
jgi:hypothetical protein